MYKRIGKQRIAKLWTQVERAVDDPEQWVEFHAQLSATPAQFVAPLGELWNPALAGYVMLGRIQTCIGGELETISRTTGFIMQGLEGAFRIDLSLMDGLLLSQNFPGRRFLLYEVRLKS